MTRMLVAGAPFWSAAIRRPPQVIQEGGDDRVSGTDSDRHDDISHNGAMAQADRAVLERAGSREPANRGLAHTVGARQIGLHSPVSESLEGLLALVGCQLDRAAVGAAAGQSL